jgi:hypothetical protein
MSDPAILTIMGYPLKPIDAITALIERNTMALPQLKSDLAKKPAAQRKREFGFVDRSLEIQHLYLARLVAMKTTIEFLLECRPIRLPDGWEGIDAGGVAVDPPPEVKVILNELQRHLDKHGRGVPP